MSVDELIEIEIMVRERIEALQLEIDEAQRHMAPPPKLNGTEGRLSRQDTLQRHELSKDAQRRRYESLRELKASLRRMDDGSFGICTMCGKMIADDRLKAQPTAQLCQDCL